MFLRVALFIVTCVFVAGGHAAVDPCNKGPYCDPDTITPDPDDCSKFFFCDNGHWVSQQCTNESLFDSQEMECVQNFDVLCYPKCPPFTGSTVSTTTVMPGLCDEETCIPGYTGYLPDRSNCSAYYYCNDGHLTAPMVCPTHQVFDIDLGFCVTPNASFSCEYRCKTPPPTSDAMIAVTTVGESTASSALQSTTTITTTTTTQGPQVVDPCDKPTYCNTGTVVPDPSNCQQYFQCVFGVWQVLSCANGSLFNSLTLTCVYPDQVTCYPPCPTVTGSTTVGTTLPPGMCDADNTSPCVDGQKYPDRSSCTSFYLCVTGIIYHQDCPVPMVFDIDQLDCVVADQNFDCEYRCQTPTPTSQPSTTPFDID